MTVAEVNVGASLAVGVAVRHDKDGEDGKIGEAAAAFRCACAVSRIGACGDAARLVCVDAPRPASREARRAVLAAITNVIGKAAFSSVRSGVSVRFTAIPERVFKPGTREVPIKHYGESPIETVERMLDAAAAVQKH